MSDQPSTQDTQAPAAHTDPLEQALSHIEERLRGFDDDRTWILKAKPPANPNLN